MSKNQFKDVSSKVDFIKLEHEMLEFWEDKDTFNQLRLNHFFSTLFTSWLRVTF